MSDDLWIDDLQKKLIQIEQIIFFVSNYRPQAIDFSVKSV